MRIKDKLAALEIIPKEARKYTITQRKLGYVSAAKVKTITIKC